MALRGIAAGYPQIKSVNFIEYFHTKEVLDDNSEQHVVAVKLNAHVYIGKYYGVDQAEAYTKAKDVVKGFLVKSGCFDPDTRLPNVPYREYGFEPSSPLIDLTPDAFNFGTGGITYLELTTEGDQIYTAVTGIDASIDIRIDGPGLDEIYIYRRLVNKLPKPANTTTSSLAGFTIYVPGTLITVPNDYALGLTIRPGYGWDYSSYYTANITLVNTSDSNATLATLTVDLDPGFAPP